MEDLPEDVLQQLLSYLPFPSVLQARLVCRRWRSVLTSHAFSSLWSSGAPPSLWLLFYHSLSPARDNPFLSLFHPTPPRHHCLSFPSPSSALLVASSHGLLCYADLPSPRLTLLNPLSGTSASLPPPDVIARLSHLGIAATACVPTGGNTDRNPSQTTAGFRINPSKTAGFPSPDLGDHYAIKRLYIMVCGFSKSQEGPHAELYDSSKGAWCTLALPPALSPSVDDGSPRRSIPLFVFWNGKFCILSGARVLTYSLHGSEWGSIDLPTLPRIWNPLYVTLHVVHDRLFLEGNFQQQGDFQRRYPLKIGIAELKQIAGSKSVRTPYEWVEVGYMPQEFSAKFGMGSYPVHNVYTSYSDPDRHEICFALSAGGGQEDQVVIYHVEEQEWSSVPMYDSRKGAYSLSASFKGMTFQPNLAPLSCFNCKSTVVGDVLG